MTYDEAIKTCQQFALKHKIIFEDEGECGFCRLCVGFISQSGNYVNYNPHTSNETCAEISCLQSEDVIPPKDVEAYHKHDCMAVLGLGEEAVNQLARWVQKIEKAGNVRIVAYPTGAEGIQAVITGLLGYAVMVGEKSQEEHDLQDAI